MKACEDICTTIPAFYMHAIRKCKKKQQKKHSNISHSIQLNGPYKCLVGWTCWEYHNYKTYLEKDAVTACDDNNFFFLITYGYFLSITVLEPY